MSFQGEVFAYVSVFAFRGNKAQIYLGSVVSTATANCALVPFLWTQYSRAWLQIRLRNALFFSKNKINFCNLQTDCFRGVFMRVSSLWKVLMVEDLCDMEKEECNQKCAAT